MRETHRSFARKLEEAQVVPLASPYHYYYTMSTRKERRSLQPILIDDNGTPATWTFGLVFQQAIDRQDRTLLQSRRTLQLYWNHRRYTLNRNPPTTTGQGLVATTTCLVGYTPLRLHTLQDTPTRHHLANRHLAGDRLRIEPSHHTPVIKTTNHLPDDPPPTLTTDHSTTDYSMARPTNGNNFTGIHPI